MTIDLLGVAEVAKLLGVSRQRVHQLATDDDSFPSPAADLTVGKVWTRDAIETWARLRPTRRPGPKPAP